jgi:hypothetical protein
MGELLKMFYYTDTYLSNVAAKYSNLVLMENLTLTVSKALSVGTSREAEAYH